MIQGVFEALAKDYPNDDAVREKLLEQLRGSEELAVEIFRRAVTALPEPPPPDAPINPYAVGLDPQKWEADGLHVEVPA